MIQSVPFWCRIALLLLVLSLVAGIDWARNRQKATRWKEYGFLVVSGILGTVFGFLNDLITSSISPEYFIFGKGLDPGDGLTLRAGVLGMEAGFSAGAIAGAICLYASTRAGSFPPLSYRRLLGFLWRPAALAPMTALVLVLVCRHLDPAGFSILFDETLDPQQMERLLTVWWVHSGLYLGLLVSVIWIVKDIGKLRNRPQAQ